jgi:hypothetical protein
MRRGNPYYQQPLFDKYGRYEIDHSAYQEKVRGMSDAALRYTIEDARKALRALPEGRKAGYYQDEINYASDELARRRSGGRARNPYGYMIAGRTRPHAYSATRDFPYEDRVEAKRVIGERVRGMGRRGDDVSFDAYLTEPRGRKIHKTRIRVPGYAPNPDVRLHWTAQYGHKYDPRQQRSVPDLRQRVAWWRTGLKKPKDVRRAVAKAHKYARKQKDWLSHRVTVENPRRKKYVEDGDLAGRMEAWKARKANAKKKGREFTEPKPVAMVPMSFAEAQAAREARIDRLRFGGRGRDREMTQAEWERYQLRAERRDSMTPYRQKGGRRGRFKRFGMQIGRNSRRRSYKRSNPVVRRKRRAPKRGYRKLSRVALRRPRNAKCRFVKIKKRGSRRR